MTLRPFHLLVIILFASCNGQTTVQKNTSASSNEIGVVGDTVAELGNSIMVVYQDMKKNYWFGSWQTGLYRFDGNTIINFTTEHGLPSNRIDEIKEDVKGNVYFGSSSPASSVVKFDGRRFTTLSPSLVKDWNLSSGDLWFRHAYQNEKVYRYNGQALYELSIPKPPGYNDRFEIYSIYTDTKGHVWFGTNPLGVCRYDGKNFDWIVEKDVAEIFNDPNEGANGVRSMLQDERGDFWFNSEYRYRIEDTLVGGRSMFYKRYKSIGTLDGKQDSNLDEYLSSVVDNNQDLWFVTYRDGVWKYDGDKVTHYPVQVDSKNINLFSIYKDNKGVLWLGTHENGAYFFDGVAFQKFRW